MESSLDRLWFRLPVPAAVVCSDYQCKSPAPRQGSLLTQVLPQKTTRPDGD
jgi:hypothetical protein